MVSAPSYHSGLEGKLFLGAILECSDGRQWVCDYDEQSPFHLFHGRRVEALGKPYVQMGQHLIGEHLAHFSVSSMRLLELTYDAEFVEVGAHQYLTGRFEIDFEAIGPPPLCFITEEGDTFCVANDPAGATVGTQVKVRAYPLRPSPWVSSPATQYLWIICPYSAEDLWNWRKRHS